jgi:hypothetical protein
MAIFYIDISTAKTADFWTQYVQLDGREYLFTFKWNKRAFAWYMDVADQEADPIASGVKLVCGSILLDGVLDSRLWEGTLICASLSTDDDSDPGRDDLAARVVLIYDDETRAEALPLAVTTSRSLRGS